MSKLVGAYGMVNVTESETNGKTYSNIAGLTPLPGALRNAKPPAVHPVLLFDLDAPDMAIFNSFHEKLQEAIKKSPEWQRHAGPKRTQHDSGPPTDDIPAEAYDDADIPF